MVGFLVVGGSRGVFKIDCMSWNERGWGNKLWG